MTIEKRLLELEKHIKSRRGKNRRAAFDALWTHDRDRAVDVVTALAVTAAGKNKVELGSFLASTGLAELVRDAARGRFGDVLVHEHAPPAALFAQIADFAEREPSLSAVEAARRARALGVVPLESAARKAPAVGVCLVALLDDPRLSVSLRNDAALGLVEIEPWAVWSRRGAAPLDVDVEIAAGVGAHYLEPSELDVDLFEGALSKLAPAARAARLRAARLPASAERFPPVQRARLLALVLDDAHANPRDRARAAELLATMRTPDADDAILARAALEPDATARVCARLDAAEAHAIMSPLMRKDARARDAFLERNVSRDERFIADASALLAVDPAFAARLLRAIDSPRARQEIVRAFESARSDDVAKALVAGLLSVGAPSRTWVLQASFPEILDHALVHDETLHEGLRAYLPFASDAAAIHRALLRVA